MSEPDIFHILTKAPCSIIIIIINNNDISLLQSHGTKAAVVTRSIFTNNAN